MTMSSKLATVDERIAYIRDPRHLEVLPPYLRLLVRFGDWTTVLVSVAIAYAVGWLLTFELGWRLPAPFGRAPNSESMDFMGFMVLLFVLLFPLLFFLLTLTRTALAAISDQPEEPSP